MTKKNKTTIFVNIKLLSRHQKNLQLLEFLSLIFSFKAFILWLWVGSSTLHKTFNWITHPIHIPLIYDQYNSSIYANGWQASEDELSDLTNQDLYQDLHLLPRQCFCNKCSHTMYVTNIYKYEIQGKTTTLSKNRRTSR